jgi:hypothetical protein
VGRLLKFGCLGIIGLVVLLGIVGALAGGGSSQPQQKVSGDAKPSPQAAEKSAEKPAEAKPAVASIGQTVSLRGWEVTLLDFGPWERFAPQTAPSPPPQGRLVVADMRVKNLQNSTSNFTSGDFSLRSADGREFKPDGKSATIERGFFLSQTVQPGLVTENRVVFDVDPGAKGMSFTALGMRFDVPDISEFGEAPTSQVAGALPKPGGPAAKPAGSPTPRPAEEPVRVQGTGTVKSRPFELRGGNYTIAWTARPRQGSNSCFHGGSIRPVDGLGGETVASATLQGNAEAKGETQAYNLKPGQYYADMNSGCGDWTITITQL